MKPTFIGIGAQKCASSWLYYILQDHPEVCLSEKKELDFFSFHYDNGYQWYESHFSSSRPVKAVGEISPSYFHDYRAPSRAALYDPDLKVILSLREPVERAFSHHKHLVKLGFFNGPDFSFEAGMKLNPMYVEQGLYATHLAHWLESFDQQQVLVIFMDDIKKDASAVVREVYGFLGIDKGHTPAALHDKSNPSYVVRNRALDIVVKEGRALAEPVFIQTDANLLGKLNLSSRSALNTFAHGHGLA
jgi:hypothetical protein